MALIQIVPGLFPAIDGIGDYALELAGELESSHGVTSKFLVYDAAWRRAEGSTIVGTTIGAKTYGGFCSKLDELAGDDGSPVLLHFSPYGYAKRGCPYWLLNILERWDRNHPGRLKIAFHELDNRSSNPLKSAFWLSAAQRSLVARAGRLGSFKYTNTELYRGKLEQLRSGRIALIPNFSTVGEAPVLPPWTKRERSLVIFGRRAQRKSAYSLGREALQLLCDRLKIKRIVDIGQPLDVKLSGITIESCGILPRHEVAERMAASVGSFICYPVALLTKSSTHAVSCAFGTIPFVHDSVPKQVSCPGLVEGTDFVVAGDGIASVEWPEWEQISRQVYESYQNRSLRVAANRIAASLRPLAPLPGQ